MLRVFPLRYRNSSRGPGTLSEFTLSSDEFSALVLEKELSKGQFIYLENGRIQFDEWTMPPHGEVIGNIIIQIGRQDVMDLFVSGTGTSAHVFIWMLMKCRRTAAPWIGQATGCSLDHWPRKTTEPTAIRRLPGYQHCNRKNCSSIGVWGSCPQWNDAPAHPKRSKQLLRSRDRNKGLGGDKNLGTCKQQ